MTINIKTAKDVFYQAKAILPLKTTIEMMEIPLNSGKDKLI